MDLLIAGIIGIGSIIGLRYDYSQRKLFNNFIKSKKDGDYSLLEGLVKSDKPLEETHRSNPILIKKIETFAPHFHTYTSEKIIFQSNNGTLQIPITETVKSWKLMSHDLKIANDIVIGIGPKLFIDRNTHHVDWDNYDEQINNNIKYKHDLVFNNMFKTIFGQHIDNDNFRVKYMGTHDNVVDMVSSDHFGISTLKTGLFGIGCAVAGAILLGRMTNNRS